MRIPSQFIEQNLYRRKNRRENARAVQSDARRIIHLVIALGLVLIIMQQASKPEIYESFFGALSVENDLGTANGLTDIAARVGSDQAAEIDQAITARVADGTVWRSGDFEALYLFLKDSENIDDSTGPMVGVLPLLQQPDIFRNQIIRSRGRVARSERIVASANVQGITEYWQLWVRPADGTDRPLVVITQSVPAEVAAVGEQVIDQNGPDVVIVGRFLKRLAYRSSRGADLAPVIVGKLITTPARSTDATTLATGESDSSRSRIWISIGLARIFGVSLAALAMWRTSVTANRIRQIRSSRHKDSDSFLQSLGSEHLGSEQLGNGKLSDGAES
jgi:hypothetical protein